MCTKWNSDEELHYTLTTSSKVRKYQLLACIYSTHTGKYIENIATQQLLLSVTLIASFGDLLFVIYISFSLYVSLLPTCSVVVVVISRPTLFDHDLCFIQYLKCIMVVCRYSNNFFSIADWAPLIQRHAFFYQTAA